MTNLATSYKSPLHLMTQTTCTCLWNDSSSLAELGYAIDNGAVGATCNPVIVVEVLKKELHLWKDRILELIRSMPQATEHDIASRNTRITEPPWVTTRAGRGQGCPGCTGRHSRGPQSA